MNNGVIANLGNYLGGPTVGNGINDNGDVVGGLKGHAFIHGDLIGTHDLNLLIPPGAGWQLQFATDINNAGQIVGYGLHDGALHAFRLTPISGRRPRYRPPVQTNP